MKLRVIKFLLPVLVAVLFSSCKPNKDLIYFKNLTQGEVQQGVPFSTTGYQLRENDNLYFQVSSMNQEVNQLFNPGSSAGYGSGTAQQFGTLSAQYINGYQVDQEGNIDLPIIGKVRVIGKTISQAKEVLVERVNEYFREATVTVKLLSFKYTMMGEVTQPGVYYNYNHTCTLLEAISQASGTTDFARLKHVVVLREEGESVRPIQVDLSDKSLLLSEAYYLRPNDVVYVAPDKFKSTRLNASMYALMLSTVSTLIVILKFMGE
jgi:polysaccharide export outer membrane protein